MAEETAANLSALVKADRMVLHLPTRPDWIEATVEYLRARAVLCGACQESRAGKLMIALHEAISNAVLHGNLELSSALREQGDNAFAEALAASTADPRLTNRVVEILMDYDGQRCQWIITDQGQGFDVSRVMARVTSDDPEELLSSGRGIVIMRTFLDEVKYEANGRRLILTLLRNSGVELRDHERLAFQEDITIVPIRPDGSVDWEAAYEGVARNFSAQGIGLLQSRLAASPRILIGITSGTDRPLYLPAEIKHCRAIGAHHVELGCRFQVPAASSSATLPLEVQNIQEAVDVILQRLRTPPLVGDERRTNPRIVYNDRIEIVLGNGDSHVGYARDLSHGGIAFITTVALPLEVGLVLLPQGSGPPLRVRAQVVRSVKVKDGFYDVGARFLGLADQRSGPAVQ